MKKYLLATVLALGLPAVAYGASNDNQFVLGNCVNNSRVVSDNDAYPFKCENLTIKSGINSNLIFSYKTVDSTVSFTVNSLKESIIENKKIFTGQVIGLQINSKKIIVDKNKSRCFLGAGFSSCVANSLSKKKNTQAIIFFEVSNQ